MSEDTLINDLRRLRSSLNPILTEQYKKVLSEAERRLSKEVSTSVDKPLKKRRLTHKPTRKELLEKFNNRGA